MGVIADFGTYPQWATGVRSAEVVEAGADGRASEVRFVLDAGIIKDSYVLAYRWDGAAAVRWDLAEARHDDLRDVGRVSAGSRMAGGPR